MNSLFAISWFLLLLLSMVLIFNFVGMRAMCDFFPEGRRWWQFPAQLASLAFFAAVVLNHPFG